ncbi:MAG: hypothetical protein JSU89_02510, partial [Myxococcales bacterium]
MGIEQPADHPIVEDFVNDSILRHTDSVYVVVALQPPGAAGSRTPEIAPLSEQVFASDFATRDRSEVISDAYQWRRWES